MWPYLRFQHQHLPTSGRRNTVKTAPQPLFVNRAFVALYVSIISPVGPMPISLFVFKLEAKEKKISIFHKFACPSTRKLLLVACCGLNFNSTDLSHSLFEPLYPKFFRGSPEVNLESIVCPQGPPKVRCCRFLSAQKGDF